MLLFSKNIFRTTKLSTHNSIYLYKLLFLQANFNKRKNNKNGGDDNHLQGSDDIRNRNPSRGFVVNPPKRTLKLGHTVADFPESDYLQVHPNIERKTIRFNIKVIE